MRHHQIGNSHYLYKDASAKDSLLISQPGCVLKHATLILKFFESLTLQTLWVHYLITLIWYWGAVGTSIGSFTHRKTSKLYRSEIRTIPFLGTPISLSLMLLQVNRTDASKSSKVLRRKIRPHIKLIFEKLLEVIVGAGGRGSYQLLL